MIVRGESTIIDYHAPFDQGFRIGDVFLTIKQNMKVIYKNELASKNDLQLGFVGTVSSVLLYVCKSSFNLCLALVARAWWVV